MMRKSETLLEKIAHAIARQDGAEVGHKLAALRSASEYADERWQALNPGNDLVWPDHADLVVWLLGELENTSANVRKTCAAKLYQIRVHVRQQLGERFADVMREHAAWLRRISAVSGEPVIAVAIQAAADLKRKGQLASAFVVLAAAVEDAEPSITEGAKS